MCAGAAYFRNGISESPTELDTGVLSFAGGLRALLCVGLREEENSRGSGLGGKHTGTL